MFASDTSSSSWGSLGDAIRVFAPGFVGAFAGISQEGIAIGFNTIRSANSNGTHVGLNSLLMARAMLHDANVTSLSQAVARMAKTNRGAPFMYTVCDGSGDCAVLEAGRWIPNGMVEKPLDFVSKSLLDSALLPTADFIEQNACATQRNGIYVRYMNYSYPAVYFEKFNPALWHRFGGGKLAYDPSTMTTSSPPFRFVYANFTENNEENKVIGNRWFIGQIEEDPNLVILSNFGMVPENRLMMMNGGRLSPRNGGSSHVAIQHDAQPSLRCGPRLWTSNVGQNDVDCRLSCTKQNSWILEVV